MSSSNSAKELATYKWEINNFPNSSNPWGNLFAFPSTNQIQFQSCCYPNYDIWGGKYVQLYLFLHSSDKNPLKVRYRVSILNENGDKCETQERVASFSVKSNRQYDGAFLWKRDYFLDESNSFLVNGKLITLWEVEKIDTAPNTIAIEPKAQQDLSLMSQDYQSLLESGKFSDASLIVKIGEKKFNVHKIILSARSKVFAAMFENDCEEKRQNRVEITDIPAEVCEQMLSYIYTGKIPELSENAGDLFVAADKYELDHLKTVCEQYLTTTLNIESVANTLLVADMHQSTLLRSKCIDYITDNMTKVMATEGWKALTAARIELTLELLKHLAIKAKC